MTLGIAYTQEDLMAAYLLGRGDERDNLLIRSIEEIHDNLVDNVREGYLSPHFREAEFTCNHCGKLHPDGVPDELVQILEDVRSHFSAAVTVNSGYRCPTHNKNVGGAKMSQHLLGKAADIMVKNTHPHAVYDYLDAIHDGGLGKYDTFTHVDVRPIRARW